MFCTWVSSLWSLVWNVSSDSARVMTLRILIGQSFHQPPLIGWDRPMCSCVRACYCDPGWHQWHQLTPDTNCFHLSLQSYQESLTNTNWHVIPSMWEKWRMFELRNKWRSHASCGTLLSHHDKCPHAYLQSFCQNFHNFNPFMQNFLPSLGKVWFNCSKKLESWIKVQKFLPKYQLLHQPNLI